ncbi:hypothetical protein CGZ80_26445 [Rhodopirellula sp. MGV]|nr:hypothetical protein CGZ80_26445 [Rhodopirellula sp. MGV]PNY38912.1 serine/threonine protein kinase [Rhodopirellula baltica]
MATQASVVRHLDHCIDCQKRIESFSGSDNGSLRIVTALQAESRAITSSKSTTPPFSTERPIDHTEQSLADFAVNFLKPARRDDSIGCLGDFDVISVIGIGGMGIVLKGFDTELNRPVAIKVMSPHLAALGVARQRFLREAQATAAVVHPNVMPVLSVSDSQTSLPFLVMPYVVSHSLQQRIDSTGALDTIDVLRIASQVAAALAAAHKQGLVHRDVKPANILLERGVDRAMLTDFGLARAADDVSYTRSGFIAGTPQFMSPEQARGDAIDHRSDLFSLGVVIYSMCAGHPPFQSETSYGVLRKIIESKPKPLRDQNANVPHWLETLTERLLCKDASSRPQSAAKVQDLLEGCLAHVQQPTNAKLPESLSMAKPKFASWLLFVSSTFLMLFLFCSGTMLLFWDAQAPPTGPSNTNASMPPDSQEIFIEQPMDQAIDQLQSKLDALKQEIEQDNLSILLGTPSSKQHDTATERDSPLLFVPIRIQKEASR